MCIQFLLGVYNRSRALGRARLDGIVLILVRSVTSVVEGKLRSRPLGLEVVRVDLT